MGLLDVRKLSLTGDCFHLPNGMSQRHSQRTLRYLMYFRAAEKLRAAEAEKIVEK